MRRRLGENQINGNKLKERMEREAEFELISPNVKFTEKFDKFVLIGTHHRGLLRLKELCRYANVHALFVDEHNLMYIQSTYLEHLIRFTIEMREYSQAIDGNMDLGVPNLFFDLVFNDLPNDFDEHGHLRYIKKNNMHLKDDCERCIESNSYYLTTPESEFKECPELEMDLTFFRMEFLHSLKFMHLFENSCEPTGYCIFFEDPYCKIHPDYSFCPDILLRTNRFDKMSDDEMNAMYLEWKEFTKNQRKLMAKFEYTRGGHSYDMYPLTQTFQTDGVFSLRHILNFCQWVIDIDSEVNLYWFLQDVETVVDMFNFLRNYRHIECIDMFFVNNEEPIKYYSRECSVRKECVKKYSVLK